MRLLYGYLFWALGLNMGVFLAVPNVLSAVASLMLLAFLVVSRVAE